MKQDFNERLNYLTVHRIMRKEQTNDTLEFVWKESIRTWECRKEIEKKTQERLKIRYRCQSIKMMQKYQTMNRFKCINPNSVSLLSCLLHVLCSLRFKTLRGICNEWWVAINALTWKNPIKNRFISIAHSTTSIHILCATDKH